jgi:hypothetical protein
MVEPKRQMELDRNHIAHSAGRISESVNGESQCCAREAQAESLRMFSFDISGHDEGDPVRKDRRSGRFGLSSILVGVGTVLRLGAFGSAITAGPALGAVRTATVPVGETVIGWASRPRATSSQGADP